MTRTSDPQPLGDASTAVAEAISNGSIPITGIPQNTAIHPMDIETLIRWAMTAADMTLLHSEQNTSVFAGLAYVLGYRRALVEFKKDNDIVQERLEDMLLNLPRLDELPKDFEAGLIERLFGVA